MPGSKVVIGRVARPRGIAGEVKIEPLTDDPRRFLSLKNVYVGGVLRKVVKAQVTPAGVFVALEGVGDRNAAETLRGALLPSQPHRPGRRGWRWRRSGRPHR